MCIESIFLLLGDIENKMLAELNRPSPTVQELQIERETFDRKYREIETKYISWLGQID